jgi:hypothetical protein
MQQAQQVALVPDQDVVEAFAVVVKNVVQAKPAMCKGLGWSGHGADCPR